MTAPQVVQEEIPGARRREQRGWYWYDWADSAFQTTVLTVFLGPYLTSVATTAAGGEDGFVAFLGLDLRPKAYFTALVTISVLLQIVIMPIVGALADHTGRKKQILGAFAYVGAAATLGFYLVSGGGYLLGGVLFLVANVTFGSARVVYDSFLPQISGAEERDAISSRGWGFGYLGGGLLLALNLVLYLSGAVEEGLAVRVSLASAGLWWGAFTLIPMLRLRNRRVPVHEATAARVAAGSVRQLGRTLMDLRRYPRTLLFLAAYLIYNDGVQTVIGFSATYADQELGLSQTHQIGAILMVQFIAVGGALGLAWIAARIGTKRTVLASLVVWTVVVAVAYFLQKGAAVQFYAIAFAIAIVMGGTQALSRSLYSLVIPPGREAEYFSLYQISDKGSAFLGSLVLTLALQLTDSYRTAIVSLIVFFVIGFVLLTVVNLPQAIREAGNEVPDHI
ncbi:MFS transporter [Microbispora bryophytorum]|uniref:MFS transporter n=1 Tax=Microbispora bryophytorum TaxID=1460882 RepID=A0A8H9H1J6_9ACTN|nr:MFS transporter [Microbispora bryophytorum]MBD3140166.1 MFS transporter [Microbispora bryophytorum]TQS02278.1 MFS transporter [Microbispora bryophytorum]GGO06501.1 MFS transporter [Microbispora bryophytorum]